MRVEWFVAMSFFISKMEKVLSFVSRTANEMQEMIILYIYNLFFINTTFTYILNRGFAIRRSKVSPDGTVVLFINIELSFNIIEWHKWIRDAAVSFMLGSTRRNSSESRPTTGS